MKNWPIYFKDLLHIANPKSNVGIVTLWTPKHVILDKLDQKSFHIGGQLYSKRGINFLIRNILANPILKYIVVCGAERSESGQALINFFKKGIDADYNVIDIDKAEVHLQIDKNAIEELRSNIEIIDLRGISAYKEIQNEINKLKDTKAKAWAKPREFEEPEAIEADKFPSEKTTFTLRGDFIWEVWVQILRQIMKFGSRKGMIKVGSLKELINIIAVIDDEDPYKPEMKDIFEFNNEDLKIYMKNFFNPGKGTEDYNYGERIFSYPIGVPKSRFNSVVNDNAYSELAKVKLPDVTLNQLAEVYQKLKRYKYDRGSVISIWNSWIDHIGTDTKRDVPCMCMIQFTYRNKKLYATAYFRSNDMYSAWPRNAFALRKLQYDLAKKLDMKVGSLTTISNCAQIYENDFDKAAEVIKKYENVNFCKPDQRSTLIVEVQGKEIVVRHMTPDGNIQLAEYRQNGGEFKSALKMLHILNAHEVFSLASQAYDIGVELAKAEYCVKNDVQFIQDRDWSELIQPS